MSHSGKLVSSCQLTNKFAGATKLDPHVLGSPCFTLEMKRFRLFARNPLTMFFPAQGDKTWKAGRRKTRSYRGMRSLTSMGEDTGRGEGDCRDELKREVAESSC